MRRCRRAPKRSARCGNGCAGAPTRARRRMSKPQRKAVLGADEFLSVKERIEQEQAAPEAAVSAPEPPAPAPAPAPVAPPVAAAPPPAPAPAIEEVEPAPVKMTIYVPP